MTDHMQAAIEAGAKAMAPVNGNTRNFHLFPDGWLAESKAALDAMLPHIRAMIAEEIRAEKISEEDAPNPDFREGVMLGLEFAAQIAKGLQQ